MMIRFFRFLSATALMALAVQAHAQAPAAPVNVEGAWARANVQGQKATGAFMKITAREPLRLVGGASPVAGVTEIHEMKMEGNIMRMRAVPAVELAAGQTLELKSGGLHVMLMDLKAPLAQGTQVPLTLLFRNAAGQEVRVDLRVPVTAGAPGVHTH